MPRARSCRWTIWLRSGNTSERTEVRERGRRDVGDARDLRVDADRQHRDDRIARDERAVAAAAGVVAPTEIGELPACRRGDEQLAGVRIVERGTDAVQRVRMLELGGREVSPVAPCDELVALTPHRHLHRGNAVELAREPGGIDTASRQEI